MPMSSNPADFHSATAPRWLRSTCSAFETIKDEVIFLREEVTESAALLIGMTIVWFFVEVMEYSFFALLCYISMIVILVTYTRIWLITTFYWDPHRILRFSYSRARFGEVVVHIFSSRIDIILYQFLRIAYGQNPAFLTLVNIFLYIMSIIGAYFSSLSLLYLGFVCIETLHFLEKRYWKLQPRPQEFPESDE